MTKPYTREHRLAVLKRIDDELERMLRADWPDEPALAGIYLQSLHRLCVALHTGFFHFLGEGDMEQRMEVVARAYGDPNLFSIGEPTKLSALFVEKGRESPPQETLVPGGEA